MNSTRIWSIALVLSSLILASGGCASYSARDMHAADFRALGVTQEEVDKQTDFSIAKRLDRKPLAAFPASIAVARVQGAGYRSYTAEGYGAGRFSIVTTRDVETEDDFTRIGSLPMVAGLAPLNRMVIPTRVDTEEHLRQAAASVQADMLLIYTFDTKFDTEKKLQPIGVISLGLFPDRVARVTSTASAALVDTRNGYVYGLAEGTGKEDRLANAWGNRNALDSARRRAEREAFDELVKGVETMWRDVAARYGPAMAGR